MTFNGILPIYKPKGMTSHDVIDRARRLLKMKKIGHTGTLDPDVEGVLVLCLGQATRLVEYIMNGYKIYRGTMAIGTATTTEDASGEIIEEKYPEKLIDASTFDQAMHEMEGVIEQYPPYYSAVKVNGRKLYEYARAGMEVERPLRQVTIHSFKRTSQPQLNDRLLKVDFEVKCSKGTYIRTLIVDLGKKLGYPAHLSELIRTATGGYFLDDAISLEDLERAVEEGTVLSVIQPMASIRTLFESVNIDTDALFAVHNGQRLTASVLNNPSAHEVAIFKDDMLLAIYERDGKNEGYYKPCKVFHYPEEVE